MASEADKKRRSFWGILVPCLLGWAAETALVLMTGWFVAISGRSDSNWLYVPMVGIAAAYLGFWPLCGLLMGMMQSHWLPLPLFSEAEKTTRGNLTLGIFLGLQVLVLLLLLLLSCGLVVFPLGFFLICFNKGQKIGDRWVQEHTVETFFGLWSPWGRNE